MSTARLLNAMAFAERAHRNQVRKYTGEPYIVHPLEVASIVASVTVDEDMMIAALLHDTVEDCGVELSTIRKAFGNDVAQLVHELTDVSRPEHGNREARKALDLQHTARASKRGKTIKLADLISNTRSITQHDKDFAVVYMKEKARTLDVLKEGDARLHAIASAHVLVWELEREIAA